jgi:hypothetical protein
MDASARLFTKRHNWLFAFLAGLSVVAQLVVAIAPLAEGRDGRLASHVEAPGAKTHVSHNDATCAACQARSIHGTTTRPTVPLLRDPIRPTSVVATVARVASADRYLQDNPRAPPSVI